jgi:hypothetical protein
MLPVGFEPKISVGERPQNYALDGAATGTGANKTYHPLFYEYMKNNVIGRRVCLKVT